MKKLIALLLALFLLAPTMAQAADTPITVKSVEKNRLELALAGLPAGKLIVAAYRGGRMAAVATADVAVGANVAELTFAQELQKDDEVKAFLIDPVSMVPLMSAAKLNIKSNEEEESVVNKLNVTFNGHTYTATLAENPSVTAFVEYLKSQGGSIVVHANDYGNFEKVGALGTTIVQTNTQITTVPGDLILYQGSSVCLYYSTNSWNFTRLGKLDGDLSNLKSDLGSGNVDITYSLVK